MYHYTPAPILGAALLLLFPSPTLTITYPRLPLALDHLLVSGLVLVPIIVVVPLFLLGLSPLILWV